MCASVYNPRAEAGWRRLMEVRKRKLLGWYRLCLNIHTHLCHLKNSGTVTDQGEVPERKEVGSWGGKGREREREKGGYPSPGLIDSLKQGLDERLEGVRRKKRS